MFGSNDKRNALLVANRLRADIRRLENPWRSSADAPPPKDGTTKIIGSWPGVVQVARYEKTCSRPWRTYGCDHRDDPDYWMPIPALPKD